MRVVDISSRRVCVRYLVSSSYIYTSASAHICSCRVIFFGIMTNGQNQPKGTRERFTREKNAGTGHRRGRCQIVIPPRRKGGAGSRTKPHDGRGVYLIPRTSQRKVLVGKRDVGHWQHPWSLCHTIDIALPASLRGRLQSPNFGRAPAAESRGHSSSGPTSCAVGECGSVQAPGIRGKE